MSTKSPNSQVLDLSKTKNHTLLLNQYFASQQRLWETYIRSWSTSKQEEEANTSFLEYLLSEEFQLRNGLGVGYELEALPADVEPEEFEEYAIEEQDWAQMLEQLQPTKVTQDALLLVQLLRRIPNSSIHLQNFKNQGLYKELILLEQIILGRKFREYSQQVIDHLFPWLQVQIKSQLTQRLGVNPYTQEAYDQHEYEFAYDDSERAFLENESVSSQLQRHLKLDFAQRYELAGFLGRAIAEVRPEYNYNLPNSWQERTVDTKEKIQQSILDLSFSKIKGYQLQLESTKLEPAEIAWREQLLKTQFKSSSKTKGAKEKHNQVLQDLEQKLSANFIQHLDKWTRAQINSHLLSTARQTSYEFAYELGLLPSYNLLLNLQLFELCRLVDWDAQEFNLDFKLLEKYQHKLSHSGVELLQKYLFLADLRLQAQSQRKAEVLNAEIQEYQREHLGTAQQNLSQAVKRLRSLLTGINEYLEEARVEEIARLARQLKEGQYLAQALVSDPRELAIYQKLATYHHLIQFTHREIYQAITGMFKKLDGESWERFFQMVSSQLGKEYYKLAEEHKTELNSWKKTYLQQYADLVQSQEDNQNYHQENTQDNNKNHQQIQVQSALGTWTLLQLEREKQELTQSKAQLLKNLQVNSGEEEDSSEDAELSFEIDNSREANLSTNNSLSKDRARSPQLTTSLNLNSSLKSKSKPHSLSENEGESSHIRDPNLEAYLSVANSPKLIELAEQLTTPSNLAPNHSWDWDQETEDDLEDFADFAEEIEGEDEDNTPSYAETLFETLNSNSPKSIINRTITNSISKSQNAGASSRVDSEASSSIDDDYSSDFSEDFTNDFAEDLASGLSGDESIDSDYEQIISSEQEIFEAEQLAVKFASHPQILEIDQRLEEIELQLQQLHRQTTKLSQPLTLTQIQAQATQEFYRQRFDVVNYVHSYSLSYGYSLDFAQRLIAQLQELGIDLSLANRFSSWADSQPVYEFYYLANSATELNSPNNSSNISNRNLDQLIQANLEQLQSANLDYQGSRGIKLESATAAQQRMHTGINPNELSKSSQKKLNSLQQKVVAFEQLSNAKMQKSPSASSTMSTKTGLDSDYDAHMEAKFGRRKDIQERGLIRGINGVEAVTLDSELSNSEVIGLDFFTQLKLGQLQYSGVSLPIISAPEPIKEEYDAYLTYAETLADNATDDSSTADEDTESLKHERTSTPSTSVHPLLLSGQATFEQFLNSKTLAESPSFVGGFYFIDAQAEQRVPWYHLSSLYNRVNLLNKIHCFDISHTAGDYTTASAVSQNQNGAIRAEYRDLKIEGITGGDDIAAMVQAINKRYGSTYDLSKLPELLLIDGGENQLRFSYEEFTRMYRTRLMARNNLHNLLLKGRPLLGHIASQSTNLFLEHEKTGQFLTLANSLWTSHLGLQTLATNLGIVVPSIFTGLKALATWIEHQKPDEKLEEKFGMELTYLDYQEILCLMVLLEASQDNSSISPITSLEELNQAAQAHHYQHKYLNFNWLASIPYSYQVGEVNKLIATNQMYYENFHQVTISSIKKQNQRTLYDEIILIAPEAKELEVLPRSSEQQILLKARDAAHNYANQKRVSRRERTSLTSIDQQIEGLPGIGPVAIKKLKSLCGHKVYKLIAKLQKLPTDQALTYLKQTGGLTAKQAEVFYEFALRTAVADD